jgi:hypothetical protein
MRHRDRSTRYEICPPVCIGTDIPATIGSISLRCGERRRCSAISPRMSDALDCYPCSGYHVMYAAINDIGVRMPDITVSHANYRFRASSRRHSFSRGFAD